MPYDIYIDYLRHSDIVHHGPDGEGLARCAPDQGARAFVKEMFTRLGLPKAKFILLDKERSGERQVEIALHRDSETTFEAIRGHDVVLLDDMVRTGSTVVKTCRFLKQIDMSSRNPRFIRKIWSNDELPALQAERQHRGHRAAARRQASRSGSQNTVGPGSVARARLGAHCSGILPQRVAIGARHDNSGCSTAQE